MTFAERLKIIRELYGMSQQQLAQLSRHPNTSISHFEAGRREPTLQSFVRIVKALNVSADMLLGISEDNCSARSRSLAERLQK